MIIFMIGTIVARILLAFLSIACFMSATFRASDAHKESLKESPTEGELRAAFAMQKRARRSMSVAFFSATIFATISTIW